MRTSIHHLLTVGIGSISLLLLACSTDATGSDLSAGGGGAAIDWVNFLRFNGITYVVSQQSGNHGASAVSRDVLGPEYTRVQFMVAGNVTDPGYKMKDGDAAFWDKGTACLYRQRLPARDASRDRR